MVERSYVLIEALAALLCIYGLYGEKFKWNIYTILYLSIDFIGFQIEYVYESFSGWELILYTLLFIYIRIQFKGSWKVSIINYILCIISCPFLQLTFCYPLFALLKIESYPITYYFINGWLLFLIFILYKTSILNKIALYMQQKDGKVILILVILASFLIFAICTSSVNKELNVLDYYLLICSIILLFLLLYYLQKERMINQQMRVEKDLNSLYGNALAELIENVRMNQHDYKNQLTTIQGMAYTAQNIEELRTEQEKYYKIIEKEDKYYQIINGNNDSVIAGFLYSKLCNIDMENVQVRCFLKVNKIEDILLKSDVIKVLGILIDNAFEEIDKEEHKKKRVDIELVETENLKIRVGNVCHYTGISEMEKYFKKGNSSKGKGRGLGLYNVVLIVRRWKGTISPENVEQNGENWFYITVEFPNKKRP